MAALPFSREAFYGVFTQYNRYVWPAQIVLWGAAIASVAWLLRRRAGGRGFGWLLASFWAWMAVAYHAAFFARINPAAWLFAVLFWAAAALFAWHAERRTLRFELGRGIERTAALAMFAYAFVGYPLIGAFAGERYPATPTFGLPCPTTIFTLGLLLLARRPVPAAVFVVPVAWSFVGGLAAFQLGVPQDFGLLAAGLITAALLLTRASRTRGDESRPGRVTSR